jgi:hypothetical protein
MAQVAVKNFASCHYGTPLLRLIGYEVV